MVNRTKLKELVYKNFKKSGDTTNFKQTFYRLFNAISEIRLSITDEGVECLLALIGSHVYRITNKDLIEAFKECSKEISSSNINIKDYILELDKNDKRILATN